MNQVLEWVKANVFIVVFSVLMVAAAITLPIFAGRMNADVRKVVTDRAANFTKLNQLERGEIVPGYTGVPNDQMLRLYEEISRIAAADAANVRQAALEHNRKGRGVALPELFPEPPQSLSVTLPERFHERLVAAYGSLLREVGAGMPPSLESLRRDLEMVKTQFVTQDRRKSTEEKLEPEEQEQLREKLSNHRLSMYVDAADNITMYVAPEHLRVPGWSTTVMPSLSELFNWQWQFWIADDILRALHAANKEDGSVRRGPVKRVVGLTIRNLPADAARSSSGAGGGGSAGFGGGMPGAGGGSDFEGSGGGGVAPVPANPKTPAPRNYRESITGRVTNPLYDVIYADLGLIVETRRLPQVLDELARYNFMTITGMTLRSVDTFSEIENGFFYGAEPVCEVQMTIETIWLRDWTAEFMPKSTKQALGVPAQPGVPSPAADV